MRGCCCFCCCDSNSIWIRRRLLRVVAQQQHRLQRRSPFVLCNAKDATSSAQILHLHLHRPSPQIPPLHSAMSSTRSTTQIVVSNIMFSVLRCGKQNGNKNAWSVPHNWQRETRQKTNPPATRQLFGQCGKRFFVLFGLLPAWPPLSLEISRGEYAASA